MKLTIDPAKFTYKTLLVYGSIAIILLILVMPVFANGSRFLDSSPEAEAGLTLQSARPLSKGMNINHLDPGEENWYVYSRDSFNDPSLSWLSLALRYESEAVITSKEANFQIIAQKQPTAWNQFSTEAQDTLGFGSASPLRRSDAGLTETFWTGEVADRQNYYVRVFNQSPFRLEYALEAKAEQPAVAGAVPAAISDAEGLSARQMAWTLTAQAVDNMTAVQAAQWMRQAQSVGWLVTAGTPVAEIADPGQANPQTLWNLTAQAIEGQDAAAAAQWLIQADSLGWLNIPPSTVKNPFEDIAPPQGGGDEGSDEPEEAPAVPAPPDDVYAPVNIYPNNPLTFNFNEVNSGRLAPNGEHWYELHRDDLDEDLIEDMALTMFYTPNQGFVSNKVNFELFPAGQYHIWDRGDADYMEGFGMGMWVSRDKDPHTSERLWAGSLVDGDRYLIKITNGTPEEVDYYLFPNDVQNAELGNPTLHQGDPTAGRVPYAAPSPPTRSGPPPEPGTGPPEAVPLEIGVTEGVLQAGEEMWYKFEYSDTQDPERVGRDFIFYLTNTPLDDIRARHADFEIYPGAQLHLWVRGTVDELAPLGASAPATFAELEDERSLQVLWAGQLRTDDVYYVRVHNHDIGPLEYEFKIKAQ